MAVIIWALAIIAFAVIETITAQLVSIWFVVGAVGALVAVLLGATMLVQIIVFIAVSALVLVFTRPLVKKIRGKEIIATNADSLIGKTTVVTEAINPMRETGAVKLSGVEWSARSADGSNIALGERVRITKIDGVKLIVTPQED